MPHSPSREACRATTATPGLTDEPVGRVLDSRRIDPAGRIHHERHLGNAAKPAAPEILRISLRHEPLEGDHPRERRLLSDFSQRIPARDILCDGRHRGDTTSSSEGRDGEGGTKRGDVCAVWSSDRDEWRTREAGQTMKSPRSACRAHRWCAARVPSPSGGALRWGTPAASRGSVVSDCASPARGSVTRPSAVTAAGTLTVLARRAA